MIFEVAESSRSRSLLIQYSPMLRAFFSSSTQMNSELAWGTREKPMTSTGMAGRLVDPPALIVDHGPDPAEFRFADKGVSLPEGSFLNQNGRHRTPAPIQLRLNDDAPGRPVGIGLEFHHIRLQEDQLQQLFDPDLLLGGDLAKDRLAAPFLGHQIVFRQRLS